jgi:DNA-binding response OmpR family regulator
METAHGRDAAARARSTLPPAEHLAKARAVSPLTIVMVGNGVLPCLARAEALRDLAFRVITTPGGQTPTLRPFSRADLFLVEGHAQFVAGQRFYAARRAAGGARTIVIDDADCREARIRTLELGADDVVASDCTVRELWARIKAVLNLHRVGVGATARKPTAYAIERLGRFNPALMVLHLAEGPRLVLSRSESALLNCLAGLPGAMVSRNEILDTFPDDLASGFERSIDQTVSRLRRRLAPHGRGELIETCPREGYRLNAHVRRVHG